MDTLEMYRHMEHIHAAFLTGLIVLITLLTCSPVHAQNEKGIEGLPDTEMIMLEDGMAWEASDEQLDALRSQCWSTSQQTSRACVPQAMEKLGAPAKSVRLARVWNDGSYLRHFASRQGIKIAIVHAPFRIQDAHQLLLIDVDGHIINVDNDLHLSRRMLMNDAGYKDLYASHPALSFHPADRSPAHLPVWEEIIRGRFRVIIEHRLTDGCRACARVGFARVGIYFDESGRYLAQKFLGVYTQSPEHP